jgi:hypothetical protein
VFEVTAPLATSLNLTASSGNPPMPVLVGQTITFTATVGPDTGTIPTGHGTATVSAGFLWMVNSAITLAQVADQLVQVGQSVSLHTAGGPGQTMRAIQFMAALTSSSSRGGPTDVAGGVLLSVRGHRRNAEDSLPWHPRNASKSRYGQ